ncbi:Nitrogen permease regulator 2, partial [Spiromyces aspiralis]
MHVKPEKQCEVDYPRLVGVFYTQFHNEHGPMVEFSVPENLVTRPLPRMFSQVAKPSSASNTGTPTRRVKTSESRGSATPSSRTTERAKRMTMSHDRTIAFATLTSQRDNPVVASTSKPTNYEQDTLEPTTTAPANSKSRSSRFPVVGSAIGGTKRQKQPLCYVTGDSLLRCVPPARRTIDFDEVSWLTLPRDDYRERTFTIYLSGYKIISCPISITGERWIYERNELIYCLCFVFESWADIRCYLPVVRRVVKLYKDLELMGGYLRGCEAKPILARLMEKMICDLNSYGECHIDM